MNKILISLLLLCLVICRAVGLHAESDHTKENEKINTIEQKKLPELQLFQINHVLNYLSAQLTPELQLRGIHFPRFLFPDKHRLSKQPNLKKMRLSRAVLTGLGHFLYATSSYWIRQDVMKEDWEYQLTWQDQKKRYLFIDGMRFDSNTFSFNWTHSGAGSMYYNYARGNRMNPFGSLLYTIGASYFWEFVVEFKEVVSLNDMIGTPIGGFSIGESLFQLGRHFRSRKGTFLNKIMRFVSNPMISINDWLDRKRTPNQYAMTEDYFYDIRIATGLFNDSYLSGDADKFFNLGFQSELILLPEYDTDDSVARWVSKTMHTQYNVDTSIGSKGIYELRMYAKSLFFGYFQQDIRTNESTEEDRGNDQRVGYSFFIGAASAFDMYGQVPEMVPADEGPTTTDYEYLTDKYTAVNLVGPSADVTFYYKGLKLRAGAEAFVDFSLIHSHAFKSYLDVHTIGQTKATLQNHGYYYALGYTLGSQLELSYGNLELNGRFKYHYFDSIEGLDRFQKDINQVDDFDLKDQRLNMDFSLGYTMPRLPIQIKFGYEHRDRRGEIGGFARRHVFKRSYLTINFLL